MSDRSDEKNLSPGRLAWRKFRRNPLALVGSITLIFFTLLSIFAYALVADDTEWANLQIPEMAKSAPGTKVRLVMKPNEAVQRENPGFLSFLIFGKPDYRIPVPVKPETEIKFQNEILSFTSIDGEEINISWPGFTEADVKEFRYWLGSDGHGRDLLSRLLLGGRVSLSVGLLAVIISLVLGTSLGAIAGFFGGWVDTVVMWFVSVVWSIPTLLLAISLTFIQDEKSFWMVFVAIGLSMWVEIARIVRGRIMEVREEEFVEATKALGFSDLRSIIKHVLPNVMNPVLIVVAANFATAILLEAGLSFLGLGVQPPVPSWGGMIREGYANIIFESGKWLAIFPGLAIVFVVISLNLVGLGLRDALDPRLNKS